MTFSNFNFYFETSAVNYLVDRFNWKDALATKGLQSSKGNIWYISPVTIWEILLTNDLDRREKIIFYCQHLFHERLINSPSEFIIQYLDQGCPRVQEKIDFHSKLLINHTWKDICLNKSKTFVYEHDSLKERFKYFQKLSKQLDKIINRVILDLLIINEEHYLQDFVNVIFKNIEKDLKYSDPHYNKVIKIAILFVFFIFCLEAEFDNRPIVEYWKKTGIDDSMERYVYLLNKYPDIITRGPFYHMAIMAFHQISLGQISNRGLFMDCLHSLYIPYTDIFITNDLHFKSLRDKNLNPNFSKVIHISEIEFVTELKQIQNPES